MRKQIYFSNALDKDLLAFIEKQSNLSRTVALGVQILYEVFGNIDLAEYLPPGFEANEELVTYEKLLKKAGKSKEEVSTTSSTQSGNYNSEVQSQLHQNFSDEELTNLMKIAELIDTLPLSQQFSKVSNTNDNGVVSKITDFEVPTAPISANTESKSIEPIEEAISSDTQTSLTSQSSVKSDNNSTKKAWEGMDPEMDF